MLLLTHKKTTGRFTDGYTLIEILVALAIVGVLFGAGYANFRDFTRRQVTINTVKGIQADLRLAQGMALAGTIPTDARCTGTNRLNGYHFRILSANHYEIRASCTGGNASQPSKDVVLPVNVNIANPLPNPNPILFKILGMGTNIGSSNATIRVNQVGSTNFTNITVSAGGQIQ